MKQQEFEHPLSGALQDLQKLQHVLTSSWSKYYGHFFVKVLGTDTIPIVFVTMKGDFLKLVDPQEKVETIFFRLEDFDKDKQQVKVNLLRGVDFEGNDTYSMKYIAKLEKTKAYAVVNVAHISAIQIIEMQLLGDTYFIEEKW